MTHRKLHAALLRALIAVVTSLIAVVMSATHSSAVPPLDRSERRDQLLAVDRYTEQVDRYVEANKGSFLHFARDRGTLDDGNGPWRRTPADEVDQPLESNGAARVWRRDGRVVLVVFTVQSESRDWALFVSDYYRPDGTLARLESVLNTFYGRFTIERSWDYAPDGMQLRFHAAYYQLGTRDQKALNNDFIDVTVPLYPTVTDLPFFGLLRRDGAPN